MAIRHLPGVLAMAAVVLFPIASAQPAPVFHDPAAPLDRRVADVLSRMTLEEKVSQMMNDSPAIERLGVPGVQLVERVPARRRARRPRHRVPAGHRPGRHLGHRT